MVVRVGGRQDKILFRMGGEGGRMMITIEMNHYPEIEDQTNGSD